MTETLIQYVEWAAAGAAVWGFLLIFIFMTIESSFIPFPSEVVMIPAGFLAARGALPFETPLLDASIAVLCGILGSLAGAYINYFLAVKLGRPFLYKFGKYVLLKPQNIHRAEEVFLEYGALATFVCRLLPAIRQLISIPAGLARMPLGSFTLFTGLGAGIWVIVLTALGYYMGKTTSHLSYGELIHTCKDILHDNLAWIVLSCVVIVVVYVYLHKKVMTSSKRVPLGDGDAIG